MKLKLFLIFITLFMLTAGCITNSQHATQEKYDLKYDFEKGEQYSYEVLATIEKPNTKVSGTTEVHVVNTENDHINLKVLTETTANTKSKEENYYINMNTRGKVTKLSSNNLIVPEIQLELVSILQYPEKEFAKGDIWNSYFNKNDSFFIDDNLVEYTVFGNNTYECLGRDEISVNAGKFDCVAIGTTTNYILDVEFKSENKSIHLKTIGTTLGENWIDLDRGILIKSEYNLDKNTITNYSEIYKEIGIENAYRENPLKSYITSELLNIEGD